MAANDRDGLRLAVEALRALGAERIILGGQSYGGRQATILAAENADLAGSLLLFSYPLHPPGKPERLRTEHFPRLHVPCFFVQGSADPFGTPAELGYAIMLIPGPTQLLVVEGAGHDLKRGRIDLEPVIAVVLDNRAPRASEQLTIRDRQEDTFLPSGVSARCGFGLRNSAAAVLNAQDPRRNRSPQPSSARPSAPTSEGHVPAEAALGKRSVSSPYEVHLYEILVTTPARAR